MNRLLLSDNNIGGSLYFYPHDMERSLFVESFTGQDCPQCPGGHTNIVAAINSFDGNIVEMTHHSGYQPDMFTMAEDDFARFFYSDPAHTYAPAVMVNRYTCDALSSAPVIQIEGSESVTALLSYAALAKPYVSLNLETKFDESTRELTVKLQMKPHTQLPSDNTLFNVYLVQDGLTGYQSNGGTNYTHNRVCRGAITGNSWGILADNLTPGEATTWETTIVVPDSIHSSYWTDDMLSDVETKNGMVQMYGEKYLVSQTNIEAVAKDMSVVAFAATRQIEDIEYIRDHYGLENLPEALRQMAEVRLENPDAPLKELGEYLDPPVGKSGVNHRLRKLSCKDERKGKRQGAVRKSCSSFLR